MRPMLLLLLPLCLASHGLAADLAVTETPIGRLALPVLPDSLVISPDSSRLAFATNAGNITLEDKGVFLQPPTGRQQSDNLPKNIRATVRLYVDDKPTAAFEVLTPVVFSPDSQRVAYTGQRDGKWQVVIDNRTVLQDADAVPATPIAFSPDSQHVAVIVQKSEKFLVSVDGNAWPPIDAYAVGIPAFSPDGRHLALIARIKAAWVLFIDGKPLPTPAPPAIARGTTTRPAASRPAPILDHFGEFRWRPDASGLVFYGSLQGSRWQCFSQSLDGTFTYTSPPVDAILKNTPSFAPDGLHFAFGAQIRGKWSVLTDSPPTTPSPAPEFDALRPDALTWLDTDAGPKLAYLAQRAKKWQFYLDHQPAGAVGGVAPDAALDAITDGSFQSSPDRRHYAFAGIRNAKPAIIKDGQILSTPDELGAGTFAFSPDSQHLAYAARSGSRWFVWLDAAAGTAPFNGIAAQPIRFSPDSTRLAFTAIAPDKTWRLVVGKDADLQSKAYDSFLKGSIPTWRDTPTGLTLTTLGIQKRIALRIESRP